MQQISPLDNTSGTIFLQKRKAGYGEVAQMVERWSEKPGQSKVQFLPSPQNLKGFLLMKLIIECLAFIIKTMWKHKLISKIDFETWDFRLDNAPTESEGKRK